MREVEYPVEVLWPTGWAGERPNPFYSYDEYEDVFLKPILKDVAELRELLKKHRIGDLNDAEVNREAGKVLSRQEKAVETAEKVLSLHIANPAATDQQIADQTKVSRRRVGQIRKGNEKEAKPEPKLLKHGGNMAEQPDNSKVAKEYGNKADYILARLTRDGHSELVEQVKAGTVTARKAGLQVGIVKPESQLTVLRRAWRKASETERTDFKEWIAA